MNKEEIYTFNEYVLGYDKGNNDRSCLTISKIQNGNMYVMSSLYDGSADVISMMLDNLQQENKQLKEKLDCDLKWSFKCDELTKENQQLKEQLLVAQTNEETFRLEMEDITKTLGLDEDTLFDDVKAYVRSLKDNWNKLKEYIKETKLKEFETSFGKRYGKTFTQAELIVCNMISNKMQELQGSDNNE